MLSCKLMYNTSRHTLKLLASLVWYSGAVVLFYKSSRLLLEAHSINPDNFCIWLAVLAGLIIGAIKAKYLFKRLCKKNLKRINALEQPKLWNFYRMRFFFLSACNDHTGQFYLPAGTWKLCNTFDDGNHRSLSRHCPAWQQQLFLEKTIKIHS